MYGLTLPRLHPSIPVARASASVEAFFLEELERRRERGHTVNARRASTAQAAMEATLRRFFNPRGGPSERFISLAIVLDDQAHYDESSDMREGDVAWSIFPTDQVRWAYIGESIKRLEALRPGVGETVLYAIHQAAWAVDGVFTANDALNLSRMMYWDEATTDEDATLALRERGYEDASDSDRPMLPSELQAAAGGQMWCSPQKKLGHRALRSALAPLGADVAARLSGLVGSILPRASKACRQTREVTDGEGSWTSFAVAVWTDEASCNHAQRLIDDIENDRANSGGSDVLYRCATEPYIRPRRRSRSPKCNGRPPRTGDGLEVLAAHLWVYHYLDRTLSVLVDLQDSLPR